jgi:hypothetical protein
VRLERLFRSKRVHHEANRAMHDGSVAKPGDRDPGTIADLESKVPDADLAGGVLCFDTQAVLAVGKALGVEGYLGRRPLIGDWVGRVVEIDADARIGHV